jgi:hypothetical protein
MKFYSLLLYIILFHDIVNGNWFGRLNPFKSKSSEKDIFSYEIVGNHKQYCGLQVYIDILKQMKFI